MDVVHPTCCLLFDDVAVADLGVAFSVYVDVVVADCVGVCSVVFDVESFCYGVCCAVGEFFGYGDCECIGVAVKLSYKS